MISPRALIALALLSGTAGAQDWTAGQAARTLEGPAHEALMAVQARPETSLAPFETDGCSGGLSDVWRLVAGRLPDFAAAHQSLPLWEACCVTHDRAYHRAGGATDAGASFAARLHADRALRSCVTVTGADRVDALATAYEVTPDQIAAAYDSIAQAMFLAVRFGGRPVPVCPGAGAMAIRAARF